MAVVDDFIALAGDGPGKKIDNSLLTVSGISVYRQRTNIAGPDVAAAIAQVRNAAPSPTDWGLVVWPIGTLKVDPSAVTSPVSVVGTVPVSGTFNLAGTYHAAPVTFTDGQTNVPLQTDINGYLKISGTINANLTATATASAALGWVDGSTHNFNLNLAGALRVDPSAVISPVSVSNSVTPIDISIASPTGADQALDIARAARQGFWGYCASDVWINIVGGAAAANGAGCFKYPAGTMIVPPAGMAPVAALRVLVVTAAVRLVMFTW